MLENWAYLLGGFTILGCFLTLAAWINSKAIRKLIVEENKGLRELITQEAKGMKELIAQEAKGIRDVLERMDERADQRHKEMMELIAKIAKD